MNKDIEKAFKATCNRKGVNPEKWIEKQMYLFIKQSAKEEV